MTNTATASGSPPNGPNVTSSASAKVLVITPNILISKLPATQTVTSGSTVTWTITVTNTGDVTLTNVAVADPLAPNCVQTFVGPLAPGASEPAYTDRKSDV